MIGLMATASPTAASVFFFASRTCSSNARPLERLLGVPDMARQPAPDRLDLAKEIRDAVFDAGECRVVFADLHRHHPRPMLRGYGNRPRRFARSSSPPISGNCLKLNRSP